MNANFENNELLKYFLDKTFFNSWKNFSDKSDNYGNLELQINSKCDLKCKYCYYSKFGNKLNPIEITDDKNILRNLDMLLEWLEKNEYFPKIDIFSGEIFSQQIGFDVVKRIVEFFKKNNVKGLISIPTNFNFIHNITRENKVRELLKFGKLNNVEIWLSCSIDGKFCDSNRPYINNKIKNDDDYYDRVFSFCKEFGFGFHPMIYFEEIDKWKDNFLWFIQMMEKHKINIRNLYLLEVRNSGWTDDAVKEFYNFIKFVYKFLYEKLGDKKNFLKFSMNNHIFNLINVLGSHGRGIGCSVQSTIQLRLRRS